MISSANVFAASPVVPSTSMSDTHIRLTHHVLITYLSQN
jgi:hypothetical protein